MKWVQLGVDALGVLAWPLTLVTVVLAFRHTIRAKLADLLHLKAGTLAEMEFTRPVDGGLPTRSTPEVNSEQSSEVDQEEGPRGTEASGLRLDQQQVEQYIREAVTWGYERGGDPEAPEPLVVWTNAGPVLRAREVTTRYEIYMDKASNYRFRVKASNGQVLAVGEAFESKDAALETARLVGSGNVRADLYRDQAGRFRFRVKASNNQVIAVGEAFETVEGARAALDRLGITGKGITGP